MQEERNNIEEFLEHFEKEILPVFVNYGYTRDTAIKVYSAYCFCSSPVIEPPDESEAWKE